MKIILKTIFISLIVLASSNLQGTIYPQEEFQYFLNPNNLIFLQESLQTGRINPCLDETEDGKTLLIAAIEAGNLEAVNMLLIHNANPCEGRDLAGQPPLHCAIWNFHTKIVQKLLEQPTINVHQQDDDGILPLSTAASGGMLLNNIDDGSITQKELDTNLPICEEIIDLLLKSNIDINMRNKTGETALHAAVSWGLAPLVTKLLNCGADATLKDSQGRTPLQCAQDHEHYDIVQLLSNNFH